MRGAALLLVVVTAAAFQVKHIEEQLEDLCGDRDVNPITRENALPGASPEEWDINGAGDASIQGFATRQSLVPGETVVFKVKTPSTRYRIDIYRLGWYQGLGARRVDQIYPQATLPQEQPPCALDESTLLIDCGTWRESAKWDIPPSAVSGVYFARLVRLDAPRNWRSDASQIPPSPKFANPEWDYSTPPPCGWDFNCPLMAHAYGAQRIRDNTSHRRRLLEPHASHIYFVVRNDSAQDIVFQTSDTTWHAYNTYGTPNTYGAAAHPRHNFTLPDRWRDRRSYKRSYNVPLLTRDTRSVNMVFGAEYPMIRWLERNGYPVSYWSGVDTHSRGRDLQRFRLFLSVGHDEYWSGTQRDNVVAARDAGTTHLAFFSGNEMYWRVRWEASIDGKGDPLRTMVVYKDTQSGTKLDPSEEWTGTFRDPRGTNAPENAVTGTIFTVNAWRNDALEVPYDYADMRFWRETPVVGLKAGEKAVMLKGLLGHEWDEDIDNGHRPPGLVRLSETTVEHVQGVVDHGATFDTIHATHHLVMYKADSGVLVFGAGTVQWSWGLDPYHDTPTGVPNQWENEYTVRVGRDQLAPEKSIQVATANLFSDMGIHAGSEGRATPRDSTAPRSVLSGKTLEDGLLTLRGEADDDGGGVVGSVEVSLDEGRTWHPASTTRKADSHTRLWKYSAALIAQPTVVVLYRAIDDSFNFEPPQRTTVACA